MTVLYLQTHSGGGPIYKLTLVVCYIVSATHSGVSLSANPLRGSTLPANPLRWYSMCKLTLVYTLSASPLHGILSANSLVVIYLQTHSSGYLICKPILWWFSVCNPMHSGGTLLQQTHSCCNLAPVVLYQQSQSGGTVLAEIIHTMYVV